VSTAYTQLGAHGRRYIAQLSSSLSITQTGPLGDLCKQLVELWVTGDARAGVGVGVTSGKVPPPTVLFTTMGDRFPEFTHPGQLEGLLCVVEHFHELALTVRGYLWSAL
jgi:hypothetical protein